MYRLQIAVTIIILALSGWVQAQSARSALEIYDEGAVWHMIYVRTGPAHRETYLDDLSRTWTRQVELAEKKGFVLQHHVITKWTASPEDWDVLIIEIFPNMASCDTFWKDRAEVDAGIVADRAQEQEDTTRINAVCTMQGVQIGREIHLKSPDQRAESPE